MVEILKRSYFLAFFSGILLLSFSSCDSHYKVPESINPENFVKLNEGGFLLNEEKFFPIMINYVADFRMAEGQCILGVHSLYEKPKVYEYFSADSIELQRDEHLKLIKEMGFNTIRLCMDRVWPVGDSIAYPADGNLLYLNHDNKLIFDALTSFLESAGEQDLKVLMLIPPAVRNENIEKFTIDFLKAFNGNNVIFAYDFNNEPLYDREHSAIPKHEVYEIVSEWKEWMETYAPYQLLTIGYSEPIEVFSWDPSILPVDFLSFHTYNPLRVPNEIYWYANYSDKPWMIGETALLADGDKFPFQWQTDFMKATFDMVVACGGIGFGWWGFQEVPLVDYAEEGTGLMTSDGVIYTSDSLLPIQAKFKPAVAEVKKLVPSPPSMDCVRPSNYFNMVGYSNYVLKGVLVDEENKPIEGGVVRGWNEYYSIGQNTFTDKDGKFELYSNDEVYHVMISAPKMEMRQFHEKIIYDAIGEIPFNADSLPNRDLEYQNIDYRDIMEIDSATQQINFFEYRTEEYLPLYYSQSLDSIRLSPWNEVKKR